MRDQVSERMEQILHNENWSSRIQGASPRKRGCYLQLNICRLVVGATLSHLMSESFFGLQISDPVCDCVCLQVNVQSSGVQPASDGKCACILCSIGTVSLKQLVCAGPGFL